MPDIYSDFIDVDFRDFPEYTFGDLGAPRFAGASTYEDTVELIPRSQWQEIVEDAEAADAGAQRLVTRIYNQGREGSCVANACSQAHEIVQAKQFGEDAVVHLSAISLYKRIGRSPQSGATVSDGLRELKRRGVLPLDNPENRSRFGGAVMPNRGYYERLPADWELTAASFRGVESREVRSVEGLATALLRQEPVVVGRQGHSICYVALVFRRGRMLAAYPNSWDYSWGQPYGDMRGGFGFDSESQIRQSANWAFALRSVVVPSDYDPKK